VFREFKGVVIAEDDVVRAQLDDVVLRHLVCVIGLALYINTHTHARARVVLGHLVCAIG